MRLFPQETQSQTLLGPRTEISSVTAIMVSGHLEWNTLLYMTLEIIHALSATSLAALTSRSKWTLLVCSHVCICRR